MLLRIWRFAAIFGFAGLVLSVIVNTPKTTGYYRTQFIVRLGALMCAAAAIVIHSTATCPQSGDWSPRLLR
jgi:hypothetical protein